MFSLAQLSCLDHLVWLRSGAEASNRLHCDQSSISRTARLVVDSLELVSFKGEGEWCLEGDQSLLNLEREVHQEYRWKQGSGLRIDAIYGAAPLYFEQAVDGWVEGNFDFMNVGFPLALLRDGVIDAWLGVSPDVPEHDDAEFSVFHLTRYPAYLLVDPAHPLLRSGEKLASEDLLDFPFTSLPDHAFPKMVKVLRGLGYGASASGITRHREDKWEGRTADQVTISYGSPFTLAGAASGRVVLPVESPLMLGDALVVKRKFADHPVCDQLLQTLRARAHQLAARFAAVECIAS